MALMEIRIKKTGTTERGVTEREKIEVGICSKRYIKGRKYKLSQNFGKDYDRSVKRGRTEGRTEERIREEGMGWDK